MIENRQSEIRLATLIRLGQQITPPHPIARDRQRHTMLEFSLGFIDQVLVLAVGGPRRRSYSPSFISDISTAD